MYRRLRANGPVVLVPLAWVFVTVAHRGAVTDRTVLIAHIVIAVVIVGFTAASWSEMERGVLRVWRDVLLVGLLLTLGGIVGLLVVPVRQPFLTVTILGWMVVPAAGLAYTGTHVDDAPRVYTAGAGLSVAGAVVYAGALFPADADLLLAGLVLVAVGQTIGIANAVYRY